MAKPVQRPSTPEIAAVIPCYRESERILDVVAAIGSEVDLIIVVDDACPEHSGDTVRDGSDDPRVVVLKHETNQGVGGATLTGYAHAVEAGCTIIVKIDGDGQMDPALVPSLVAPIRAGRADYVKGNRFYDLESISGMPKIRIFGNLALSFASKMSSGYWHVFDPTNGFTAIHAKVAAKLPRAKISKSYFFESDMLFRLNIMRAVVEDMPMQAHYGAEQSSLKIGNILSEFSRKHLVNAWKRVFYTYFLRDFSVASIELVLGKLFFLFGVVFGGYQWWRSAETGVPATAGTVILAALPIILGSQFLIAFLDHDTRNAPRHPIHPHM